MTVKLPPIPIGTKFGKLEVLESEVLRYGKIFALCRCDCGATKFVLLGNLRGGRSQSCGCFQRSKTGESNTKRATHGHTLNHSPTKAYQCWSRMHRRCTYKNSDNYARYGGRGIRVCERWGRFEHFLEDMGELPQGMTIERIETTLTARKIAGGRPRKSKPETGAVAIYWSTAGGQSASRNGRLTAV